MGEIAEDIINGDSCACGEYFDTTGPGYPRFCSRRCKQYFGG